MYGWFLEDQLPSYEDGMLLFTSLWPVTVHYLVWEAKMWPTVSNTAESSWTSIASWRTSAYTYNRIYLTLIHSCVCLSDPLTRTYSTLRVFIVDIFLPAPSFHQSTTPTLLFVAILRVFKEDKTRHLTDGKLFPSNLWTARQSLDLWLNSHLRELEIRHCHRVKSWRVIELKSTKLVVGCTGNSQSLQIWNQVTTLVAISAIQVKSQLLACVSLSVTQNPNSPINRGGGRHDPWQLFTSVWGLEAQGLRWPCQNPG